MVKKTKKKVLPTDTKAKLKLKKTGTPALKQLAKRKDASLPKSGKMKKPILHVVGPKTKAIKRAEVAPTNKYTLVVDGQVKAEFGRQGAATEAAKELLAKYPMLRVEIHDASTKQRTLVTF